MPEASAAVKTRLSSQIDLEKLKTPFPGDDLEWRVSRGGVKEGRPWAKVLAYVTARAVMNRLDEVCGPENWKAEYQIQPAGVICKLSIRIAGEWITKEDGAEQTEIEAFKGGISGALKRAASVWGIGRYLYNLEEAFAEFTDNRTGAYHALLEDKATGRKSDYFWLPPRLPDWALPAGSTQAQPQGLSPLNQKLGIQPNTQPQDRKAINDKIIELYKIYPEPLPKLVQTMKERYGHDETRLLSIEQLWDLVGYMQGEIQAAKQIAPASKALPAHPLDHFVIPVGSPPPKGHKGETFKQFADRDGKEKFLNYFKSIHEIFLKEKKRISPEWQETFSKAEEYLFGNHNPPEASSEPSDSDDSGI